MNTLEGLFARQKNAWKDRPRKSFAMDLIELFDGRVASKLILQPLSPFYYASNDTRTTPVMPVVGDVSDYPTIKLSKDAFHLPKTPSGNLK
jgi:hypothetical protein